VTLLLVVIGALALLGGWYFGSGPTQAVAPEGGGQLAFPDLAPKLQQAARVEITHAGTTTVLERHGAQWVDDAASAYPVQASKLRGVLTGLTELRLAEARTDEAAQLALLGLDDPAKPGTTGTLLRVLDGGGTVIAALVLGHQRVSTQPGMPEQIFVRRPEQTQAWLAEGKLAVSDDASSWLDREIANIPTEQIVGADVQQGDQHLVFVRDATPGSDPGSNKVALSAPAEHPPLDQYKLDDVFRAYEYLSFTAVKPAAQTPGTAAGSSVFTTKDGMHLRAEVFKDGNDVWARFAASGDGAAAAKAQALDARVHGWAYQIVAWKQNALAPSLDSLKSAEPTAAAPAAAAPAAPAAALKPPGQ
jgi:hypothetical protein